MTVSAWTKHIKTDDDKTKYLESLKRVSWVLEDLKKLINSSEAALEASEVSPKSYDNPNWPYRQAHANGYKQALKDFSKLITIDQKE
jgi:hypothetical protein